MASNIISRTGIALLHNKLGAAVFIMFEHWCLICRLPTTTASLFLTVVVSYMKFFFFTKKLSANQLQTGVFACNANFQ